MAADWSQLPKELLQLISQKLNNNEFYLIRFRSICTLWRSSISNNIDSLDPKLYKHNIFLIKPPTTPDQQHRPWLIRIGPDSDGKTKHWHPLLPHRRIPSPPRVLDFNQLSVYNLVHVLYVNDGLLLCNFKGQPCVTDKIGRTLMIGSDLNLSKHLLAEQFIGGDVKYLVESECELLLVDRYLSNGDDDVRIDVFRLDEKKKKWNQLVNLGNRVLFLGDGCSFSASASDLGLENGNLVIYCEGNVRKFEMSVFRLDQGRVSLLSDYPDYFKLFLPPPEWIERLLLY